MARNARAGALRTASSSRVLAACPSGRVLGLSPWRMPGPAGTPNAQSHEAGGQASETGALCAGAGERRREQLTDLRAAWVPPMWPRGGGEEGAAASSQPVKLAGSI